MSEAAREIRMQNLAQLHNYGNQVLQNLIKINRYNRSERNRALTQVKTALAEANPTHEKVGKLDEFIHALPHSNLRKLLQNARNNMQTKLEINALFSLAEDPTYPFAVPGGWLPILSILSSSQTPKHVKTYILSHIDSVLLPMSLTQLRSLLKTLDTWVNGHKANEREKPAYNTYHRNMRPLIQKRIQKRIKRQMNDDPLSQVQGVVTLGGAALGDGWARFVKGAKNAVGGVTTQGAQLRQAVEAKAAEARQAVEAKAAEASKAGAQLRQAVEAKAAEARQAVTGEQPREQRGQTPRVVQARIANNRNSTTSGERV